MFWMKDGKRKIRNQSQFHGLCWCRLPHPVSLILRSKHNFNQRWTHSMYLPRKTCWLISSFFHHNCSLYAYSTFYYTDKQMLKSSSQNQPETNSPESNFLCQWIIKIHLTRYLFDSLWIRFHISTCCEPGVWCVWKLRFQSLRHTKGFCSSPKSGENGFTSARVT